MEMDPSYRHHSQRYLDRVGRFDVLAAEDDYGSAARRSHKVARGHGSRLGRRRTLQRRSRFVPHGCRRAVTYLKSRCPPHKLSGSGRRVSTQLATCTSSLP